jgi:hypothetical protein
MKKNVCRQDSIIERIEQHPTIKAVSGNLDKIRSMLLANLPPEQAELFRQYDDAAIHEGTVRVQQAIRAACGCQECRG